MADAVMPTSESVQDSPEQIVQDASAQVPQSNAIPQPDGSTSDPIQQPTLVNQAPLQTQTLNASSPDIDNSGKAVLYDISGKVPQLGKIDHDEVTDAVASGRYSFPKGAPVNVISPDGTMGTIDPHEAPQAFQNGYKYATPDDINQDKYGKQTGLTALEGLAQGVAGPLATYAEKHLGFATGQDIRGRAEANPLSHGLGETAGFIGSLMTGQGVAPLVEHAGTALAKGLEGVGLLSDAAQAATKLGAEMALLQSGDEVSKMITNDPNQSAHTAIADIGLAGALGGIMGGVGKGVISPLWKASGAGERVGQFVADLKGRFNFHVNNPDLQSAVEKELSDRFNYVNAMKDGVYGDKGLKAQDISNLMPEMHSGITEQANRTIESLDKGAEKLAKDPHADLYNEQVQNYKQAVLSDDPQKIWDATESLKKQMQEYGQYNKNFTPLGEKAFRNTAKDVGHDLRTSLEDTDVWGKAAERQQKLNSSFSKAKDAIDDFHSAFTTEVADIENGGSKRIIDPGKVSTLINQTDKATGDIKRLKLQNYLDATDKYMKEIGQTHTNLGIESPIAPTSMHATQGIMGKLTPGAAVADWYVKKGMNKIASESLGTSIGAAAGHFTGIPGGGLLGALLGEHALSPIINSVLPSLLKPILESGVSGSGFKTAVDYAMNVVKGDSLVKKATQNVFRMGSAVLSESQMPSEPQRMKLDKMLKTAQSNPNSLLQQQQGQGGTDHYLPAHSAALASTVGNAVNLINQQRPSEAKVSPLDSKPVIDKAHQAAFNRTLDIAQQPLMVLHHMKQGTLLPTDVATIQQLYPDLYKKVSTELTTAMINHTSKGDNTVPYKTRMGISMFLAQPMDSTMTPSSIVAAQPKPPQGPAQQEQASGGQGTQHSGKSLTKLPGMYSTKSQTREQDRSSNKS